MVSALKEIYFSHSRNLYIHAPFLKDMREITFVVICLSILVLSGSVFAAGVSEGGTSPSPSSGSASIPYGDDARVADNTNNFIQPSPPQRESQIEAGGERNCEEFETMRERIRCRLIQGSDSGEGGIEEACRGLRTQGKCVAFYATVQTCYKLEGRAKDSCFKRAAGLQKQALSEEDTKERKEKAQYYVIALLYDLQERVEKAQEKGKIDVDDAADIINKIIEMKKDILNGELKEKMKQKLIALKQLWRSKLNE